MSDPWITHRFRKYTAGPKRWPWKNHREIHRQHTYTFIIHAGLGAIAAVPLAVYVGRRARVTQGGTPLVPLNNFKYDFINLDPAFHAKRRFRMGYYSTLIIAGILSGYAFTNH